MLHSVTTLSKQDLHDSLLLHREANEALVCAAQPTFENRRAK